MHRVYSEGVMDRYCPLDRLHTLVLQHVNMDLQSFYNYTDALHSIPHLTDLSILRVTYRKFPAAGHNPLDILPVAQLQRLAIDAGAFGEVQLWRTRRWLLANQLRSLTLFGDALAHFSRYQADDTYDYWVMINPECASGIGDLPALESLEVSFPWDSGLEHIQLMMTTLFPVSHLALRRLKVWAPSPKEWPGMAVLGTMFPNVEELYLDLTCRSPYADNGTVVTAPLEKALQSHKVTEQLPMLQKCVYAKDDGGMRVYTWDDDWNVEMKDCP
jgi:hypothetical protein